MYRSSSPMLWRHSTMEALSQSRSHSKTARAPITLPRLLSWRHLLAEGSAGLVRSFHSSSFENIISLRALLS